MNRILLTILLSFVVYAVVGQKLFQANDSIQLCETYQPKLKRNVLVTTVGVGVAFMFDKPIQSWMMDHQSDFGDNITDVTNVFGEKKVMVPALGATLGLSYLIKDDKLKRASWNAVKAVAVTALTTEGLKISLGRARPYMDNGPGYYKPFENDDQFKSLPSGHVSLAFAIFTPYAETYSRWLYAVPASVAFARMYKNKHWFSDVVLGGGLGFISGWIFTHHPGKRIQFSANGLIVLF